LYLFPKEEKLKWHFLLLVRCLSPSLEHPQLCVALSRRKVVLRHSHSPLVLTVYGPLLAKDGNNMKLKLSFYRPGEAHKAPRTYRESAHKCGKVVGPTLRPPLSLKYSLEFIFLHTDLIPGK
jgi:hypothetical protein